MKAISNKKCTRHLCVCISVYCKLAHLNKKIECNDRHFCMPFKINRKKNNNNKTKKCSVIYTKKFK